MNSSERARGKRGSWFASVGSEKFACVHEHWWDGCSYSDPGLRCGDKKAEELVKALRQQKQAILTKDIAHYDDHGNVSRMERVGYIALFRIADVKFDGDGLRFRFVERLKELDA